MTDPYRDAAEAWLDVHDPRREDVFFTTRSVAAWLREELSTVMARVERTRLLLASGLAETPASEAAGRLARILSAIAAVTPAPAE